MENKKQVVIFLLVMGLLLTLGGLKLISDARSNVSWPTAEGVITKSEKGSERVSIGSSEYHDFPDIKYSFKVQGEEYTGFMISSRDFNEPIEKTLEKYPVGKKVIVHYNPKDPSVAYLETGASFQSYIGFFIGIIFLITGISIAIFVKKKESPSI